MRFKIGDRVVATKPYDRNNDIVGKKGIITKVHSYFYGVEFDEPIDDGHTCRGYCKNGYGWEVNDENLEFANINKRIS